jgi:hypothetical protein
MHQPAKRHAPPASALRSLWMAIRGDRASGSIGMVADGLRVRATATIRSWRLFTHPAVILRITGAVYGAIQRAGEKCSQWDPYTGLHTIDRELVPVDCGGGWFCMTYCTLGKGLPKDYY